MGVLPVSRSFWTLVVVSFVMASASETDRDSTTRESGISDYHPDSPGMHILPPSIPLLWSASPSPLVMSSITDGTLTFMLTTITDGTHDQLVVWLGPSLGVDDLVG